MITVSQAENIQNILIERFGGSKGIRDRSSLQAALARPFATFDNEDLYPSVTDKAAALLESLVTNHPFIDGNKRTAYVLMRLLLLENALDIEADQQEKYELMMKTAKGEFSFEDIRDWLKERITPEL